MEGLRFNGIPAMASETDPGSDPGSNPGLDPGSGPGLDPGSDLGPVFSPVWQIELDHGQGTFSATQGCDRGRRGQEEDGRGRRRTRGG